MAGLSHGPQGHLLFRFSSEMLNLSEIDPTIVPLGRIRGCKFFSLCFSKNSYYFILDLTTSSPHMQKSRRMFVFLVPLKMSSKFGFISFHQFWQILCYQFFFLNLPGLHFSCVCFLTCISDAYGELRRVAPGSCSFSLIQTCVCKVWWFIFCCELTSVQYLASQGLSSKASAYQCRSRKDPWVGKSPWRREWPPPQYSCRGNPTDRGAWWAAVHAAAESDTTEWPSAQYVSNGNCGCSWDADSGMTFPREDLP